MTEEATSDEDVPSDVISSDEHSAASAPLIAEEPAPPLTHVSLPRLDFRHVDFCGRRKELEILQRTYDRTVSSELPVATTVFLKGDSGSGKSELIRCFRDQIVPYRTCCFARGKFDEGRAAAEPFGPVIQACDNVMHQLLRNDNEASREFWKKSLRTSLSYTDETTLKEFIPSLRALFQDSTEEDGTAGDGSEVEDIIVAGSKLPREVPSVRPPRIGAKRRSSSGPLRKLFNWTKARRGNTVRQEGVLDTTFAMNSHRSSGTSSHSLNNRAATTKSSALAEAFGRIDKEWSFERLCFSLRSLIRTISQFVPLVLFLDDLQWAGEDSLMLIETVICDKMPDRRLMFIGASRPVDVHHPLSTWILNRSPERNANFMKVPKQTSRPPWLFLSLDNLVESDVSDILASVLHLRDQRLFRSLAIVVHRKTRGNPFFVLQFLRLLEQMGLIFYSTSSGRWEWRSDLVQVFVEIPNDVVEVVWDKIRGLQEWHQQLLASAACLGNTRFDELTLLNALGLRNGPPDSDEGGISDFDDSLAALRQGLRALVDAGFLKEDRATNQFRFVHDRIREGSYTIIPPEERELAHLTVGRRLLAMLPFDLRAPLNSSKKNGILLQAVLQLNLGSRSIREDEEIQRVAELNYIAAEISASRSAFFPAADFLQKGLVLVARANKAVAWLEDYPLILKLSVAKARMEYCCGRYESGIRHADDIISHARMQSDKKVAYHTKLLCLQHMGHTLEAKELVLSILEENGIVFPRTKRRYHLRKELTRTSKLLRDYSDRDLISLPETSHARKNELCCLFWTLVHQSYHSASPDPLLLLAISLRMIQMSLLTGRFACTGFAFILYGAYHAREGRFLDSLRLGKLGLRLAETDGRDITRECTVFHLTISHWCLPYHFSLCTLSQTSENIDPQNPTVGCVYLYVSFLSGRSLELLSQDLLKYALTLEDCCDVVSYEIFSPFFQMISNFRGESENCVHLSGRFMDEQELRTKAKMYLTKKRIILLKFILACYFGDYSQVADLPESTVAVIKEPDTNLWTPVGHFVVGLTKLALARSEPTYARRIKLKNEASSFIRRFETWKEKSASHFDHMLLLLQAEEAAFSVTSAAIVDNVLKAYDKAIASSGMLAKGYYLHDIALANERAGVFCLEHDRRINASIYLTRAYDLYQRWGAIAKVALMKEKYGALLPDSPVRPETEDILENS